MLTVKKNFREYYVPKNASVMAIEAPALEELKI